MSIEIATTTFTCLGCGRDKEIVQGGAIPTCECGGGVWVTPRDSRLFRHAPAPREEEVTPDGP